MTIPYMAVFAASDDRQEEVQAFVSPLCDRSAEFDAEVAAAAAAFVA